MGRGGGGGGGGGGALKSEDGGRDQWGLNTASSSLTL